MISFPGIIGVTGLSTITTLLWYKLYCAIVNKYNPGEEFTSRVVAALHALVAIFLAFICIYQGPDPLDSPGEENTVLQVLTMAVSLGYFVYDLWWCLKNQTEPAIILVHHIASIMAIYIVMVCGKSGAEAVGGLFSLEFTNPILQARWFLRTYGYNGTPLHTMVEVIFITLFLIMRLGYGTKLTYAVVTCENVMILLKICTLLLYIISLVFIYFIGQFVFKKYVLRSNMHCSQLICESDCIHKKEELE